MKTKLMKSSIIYLVLLMPLICVAQSQPQKLSNSPKAERDSLENEYIRIVKGLNLNYVLRFRELQGLEFKAGPSEQQFEQDSITYWKCYQEFFNQDIRIVDWLLKYFHCSEPKKIRVCELYSPLWSLYLSHYDSNINECNSYFSNSRPAIVLILNYFDGKGFTCYECQDNKKCERNQYLTIKRFLKKYREKDLKEIRSAWKKIDLPGVNMSN